MANNLIINTHCYAQMHGSLLYTDPQTVTRSGFHYSQCIGEVSLKYSTFVFALSKMMFPELKFRNTATSWTGFSRDFLNPDRLSDRLNIFKSFPAAFSRNLAGILQDWHKLTAQTVRLNEALLYLESIKFNFEHKITGPH